MHIHDDLPEVAHSLADVEETCDDDLLLLAGSQPEPRPLNFQTAHERRPMCKVASNPMSVPLDEPQLGSALRMSTAHANGGSAFVDDGKDTEMECDAEMSDEELLQLAGSQLPLPAPSQSFDAGICKRTADVAGSTSYQRKEDIRTKEQSSFGDIDTLDDYLDDFENSNIEFQTMVETQKHNLNTHAASASMHPLSEKETTTPCGKRIPTDASVEACQDIALEQNNAVRERRSADNVQPLKAFEVNKRQRVLDADWPDALNDTYNRNPILTREVVSTSSGSYSKDIDDVPSKMALAISGKAVSVTSTNGDRVYCRIRTAPHAMASCSRSNNGPGNERTQLDGPQQLLSESITSMLISLDESRVKRFLEESKARIADQKKATSEQDAAKHLELDELDRAHESDDIEVARPKKKKNAMLWVDKYAPRSFLNLLSDEWTNREVAKWFKAWGPAGIGSNNEKTSIKMDHAVNGNRQLLDGKQNRIGPANVPFHNILVFCGAPGIGKTTLAHVVARHCGYRTVEINASDDRSAPMLMKRVQDAVQMRPVMGECRPNCVVIDEIDGVAGGQESHSAVQALLKLVGLNHKERKSTTKKERRDDSKGMARPIICICNDLYVPALRPLREQARIFHFKKPSTEKIVVFLRNVCAAENISVDRQVLLQLVENTNHDIRTCLHTLQLLGRRSYRVKSCHLKEMNLGYKDVTHGAMELWEALLSMGAPSKLLKKNDDKRKRLEALHELVADFGENELLCAGLHDNVQQLKLMDVHLKTSIDVSTLLGDADILMRAMRQKGTSLHQYVPSLVVHMGAMLNGLERMQPFWPKAHSQQARRSTVNASTIEAWLSHLSPHFVQMITTQAVIQEIAPAVKLMSRPQLRALSSHLYTADERDTIRHVVAVMASTNLAYSFDCNENPDLNGGRADSQSNDPSCSPSPLLSPPLDALHYYQGQSQPKTPLVELRQLIAQAVTAERIQRQEVSHAVNTHEKRVKVHDSSTTAPASRKIQQNSTDSLQQKLQKSRSRQPCWLTTMQHKHLNQKLSRSIDATDVGGDTSVLAGLDGHERKLHQLKHCTVLYKFKEGYTNAVKRPLLMSDLLSYAPAKDIVF